MRAKTWPVDIDKAATVPPNRARRWPRPKKARPMSKWKNKDGRTVRQNQISTQFAWQSIEMLESPAYRALSLSGHRIWARIQIEHAHHGGKENGKLPVTFRDFEKFGVCMDAIGPAIREVEALGFIQVTEEGRAGNGEWRKPNKFALTHLPTIDNPKASEGWKQLKTIAEAMTIAAAARKSMTKTKRHSDKIRAVPLGQTRAKEGDHRSDEPEHYPLRETRALSISRAVSAAGAPVLPPSSKPELVWSTPVLTEVFGVEKEELLKILARAPAFTAKPNRRLAAMQ